MLAFFGVPLCYPPEDCRDVLPRDSTTQWSPHGGTSSDPAPPCGDTVDSMCGDTVDSLCGDLVDLMCGDTVDGDTVAAASTPLVVRSFHLSATHDGCSAPECLRTRVDCDDDGSFWQAFLVIKRTMVALDPDRRAARAVALAAPRASEVRDLQRAVDRLSCDGALGFHVVQYEA